MSITHAVCGKIRNVGKTELNNLEKGRGTLKYKGGRIHLVIQKILFGLKEACRTPTLSQGCHIKHISNRIVTMRVTRNIKQQVCILQESLLNPFEMPLV